MTERRQTVRAGETPTLHEALFIWLRIGLLSFGGPAGQISLMHRVLVEEKKWIDEGRFLHALNFCMLLPGPEAQQLATYIGWILHRTVGGVIAGVLFILPGALVIFALSILYVLYADLKTVEGLFFGVKAAIIALVVGAVIRIGKRTLTNVVMVLIAVSSFVGIFFFGAPFPMIVVAAALIGFVGALIRPQWFEMQAHGGGGVATQEMSEKASVRSGLVSAIVCLVLWLAPVAALSAILGPEHVYTNQAVFFSKMAVVTFGGAYAVLAYVAQQAVESYGWLSPDEMIDGLGLAETTPGPLILVVQFVGFLGAYRADLEIDPILAGVLGGMLVTWVTFVPCFLWIFLGAPFIEALRGARAPAAALAAITAAVVGVILNLAVWFSAHVLFRDVGRLEIGWIRTIVPEYSTLHPLAAALSAFALVMILWIKAGMLVTLAICAAVGAAFAVLQGGI